MCGDVVWGRGGRDSFLRLLRHGWRRDEGRRLGRLSRVFAGAGWVWGVMMDDGG